MKRLLHRLCLWPSYVRAFGLGGYLRYLLHLGIRRGPDFSVHPARALHPLCVRHRSSDDDVLYHVFVQEEYRCLVDLDSVRLIVDCGANVGYSAAYFLTMFPEATVIAVEPDIENYLLLQQNMQPYGSRVRLLHAGIWDKPSRLTISSARYRDGRDWAKQVCIAECPTDADIDGLDIGTILTSSGHDRIALLKMDIEGAEAVVFSSNYTAWLQKVDAIAIELHDDSNFGNATSAFFRAIDGAGFQVQRHGELTICRRHSPK